jgi:predicted MFS family arabinose efflux permease
MEKSEGGSSGHRERKILIFSGLAAIYFFSYFQRVAVPGTIFTSLQTDLGLDAAQVAGLGAAFVYVYAATQLFTAALADRHGGIRVIKAGGVLLCVGALMFPLSNCHWALYLSRMVTGLGAGVMYLCLVKETDRMFGGKNFSLLMGLIFFLGYSGGMAGTLPFDRLAAAAGWRGALLCVAAATVIVWLLILKIPAPPAQKQTGRKTPLFEPLLSALRNRRSFPVLFSGSINFAVYFTVQTVVGKKFLEDFAGMDSCRAASVTFAMMITAMITLLTSGAVSRFFGNRRRVFLIIGTALQSAVMLMIISGILRGMGGPFFLLCCCLCALSTGFATIFMSSMKELNDPRYVAGSVGALNCLCYLSVALVSNCAGFLMDRFRGAVTAEAASYPQAAWLAVFGFMLALSLTACAVTFTVKETMGNHIHQDATVADGPEN